MASKRIRNYGQYFKFILIVLYIIISFSIKSQDYPLTPEIWSEPVKIDTFAQEYKWEYSASFTLNMDTIFYFMMGEIYTSQLVNGIWNTPERLNNNVNSGIMRNPSIGKNGKRIYYSAWGGYGSWDLWYNDWDDSANDWGPTKNMGPVINSPGVEWYLYEVSEDTIYTINNYWGDDAPGLYVFNHIENEWVCADSFYYHPLGAGNFSGLSITGDRKKLYLSRFSWTWPDLYQRGAELCVCYWDSISGNWGDPYFLNINSKAILQDSSSNHWIGGGEIYPWISNDGRTLIFASNRDEQDIDEGDLYISHLLVDENGDSVTSVRQIKGTSRPYEYKLFPNFPNPFNSETKFTFYLPEREIIDFEIYNLTGWKVAELIRGQLYEKGSHQISWDLKNHDNSTLSSGIYFCRLNSQYLSKTIKILYVK